MSESNNPNDNPKYAKVNGSNNVEPKTLEFKSSSGKRKIVWTPGSEGMKIHKPVFPPTAPITNLTQNGKTWQADNDTSVGGTWRYEIRVSDESGLTVTAATTAPGDDPPEVRNGPPPDGAMGSSGAGRKGGLEDPPEVRGGPPTGS